MQTTLGNLRRAAFLFFFLACAALALSSCKVPAPESGKKTTAQRASNFWTIPDSVLRKNPFSIQVAAMAERANAEESLTRLKTAKFRAFCLAHDNITGKKIYRVRVGPFRNRKGAEAALFRLRRQGYRKAFVQQHADMIPGFETSASAATARAELAPIKGAKKISPGDGCSHPRWSPTGKEIAYLSKADGQWGLYAVGTGGGAVSRIVEGSKERRLAEKFSWSPDGKRLAFVAREFNDLFEWADNLYVVSRRGSKPVRILWQERTTFRIGGIFWSPDGERLAVEELPGSSIPGASAHCRVLILTLAGDKPTAVLRSRGGDARAAGWRSPTEFVYLDSRKTRTVTAGIIEDGGLQVLRYDLNTDHTSSLHKSPEPVDIVQAGYLRRSNAVVFSALNENTSTMQILRLINLRSKKATALLEYQVPDDRQPEFLVTKDEKVLMPDGDKLWFLTKDARGKSAKLPLQPHDWTIDPSGKQMCFSRGGELFTLKIGDGNES